MAFSSSLHSEITRTFAEWTALSALRSGSPVKDRARIYPALARVRFDDLFDANAGTLSEEEFTHWHRASVHQLMRELELPAGWAAKLVNVYLKTRAYVSHAGRPGLLNCLHPPLDGGLWRGLATRFGKQSEVCRLTNARTRIKDIVSYEDYECITQGCRMAATALGCRLIEVDQLWLGARAGRHPSHAMPGADCVGQEVVLWDADQASQVIGTMIEYPEPDTWAVQLAGPDSTVVYLDAGGSSHLGRWHLMRAMDGSFVISDDYRRLHPNSDDTGFAGWLIRSIVKPEPTPLQ